MLDMITAEAATIIEPTSLAYDYGQIEDEDQREQVIDAVLAIQENYQAAERAYKQAHAGVLAVGEKLAYLKANTEHGQFTGIVAADFPFDVRQAQNLMNVWRHYSGKSETVTLFTPSALALLAAPSTPESARQAAEAEARTAGKSPTKARTIEIIREHRGETPVSLRDGCDGDQWGTPAWLVDAVRKIVGQIDLDPASNKDAQAIIDAGAYYTINEDGLSADNEWFGCVFLNPPYSKPAPWIERVCFEYAAGHVDQAIVLVNNASDTFWYQEIASVAAKCDLSRRVRFLLDGQEISGARQGQTVFYLGDQFERFRKVFADHGIVYPSPATIYNTPPLTTENAADGSGDGTVGASKCSVCGRTLTNPEHVLAGIGPVCAAHMAAHGDGESREEEEEDRPSFIPLRIQTHGPLPDDYAVLRLSMDLIAWIVESVPFAPTSDLADEFEATLVRVARERDEPVSTSWDQVAWTETDQLAWDLLPGDWIADDVTTPAVAARLWQEGHVDTEQEAEILYRRYQQLLREQGR